MLNERKLSKAEEKRKEEIVKDLKSNKREFVKRYGKDAEGVMYGTAVKRAKKQVKEMNEDRIKEAVKKALMKDEANEELVGGQKKLDADGDGKISGKDFKLLRAKKGMKEAETGTVTVKDPAQAAMLAKQGVNVTLNKEDLNPDYSEYENDESLTLTFKSKDEFERAKEHFESKSDFYPENINDEFRSFQFKVEDQADADSTEFYLTQELEGTTDLQGYYFSMEPSSLSEDLDLGHEDNEPHMIKGELYRIGKYAMELYQMVDQFEYGYGEVDFPAWWQAKITTAKNMVSSAKHYLEFELKEPEIDAMVGVASTEEVIDEEKISAEEKLAALITKALKNVANKDVSDQSNLKQARAALNKGNMDAAKKIADPYLEEGLPKGYFAKNTPGGKMKESNVNESFLAATSKRVIKDENLDSFISKMEDAGYKLAKMLGPEDNLYKDHPIIDHTWKYGLPKFNNLIGPMRDGDRFRYEDQETYDRMSLEESYDALVKKIKGQGKSEKAAKAIAGAVASYKAKGGGKGPTAKQKG
jgi:hypothetical protein